MVSETMNEISQLPIFVIQKHQARALHYDFRLEVGGVLKSWAIPKEPPSAPNLKRLAIPTEDHDLSYAEFAGEIPEGEYGAGKVEIWDKGTYELEERTESKIVIHLNGERLQGRYCMVKLKDQNWLFFKC